MGPAADAAVVMVLRMVGGAVGAVQILVRWRCGAVAALVSALGRRLVGDAKWTEIGSD